MRRGMRQFANTFARSRNSNRHQQLHRRFPFSWQNIVLAISLMFNCYVIYFSLHAKPPTPNHSSHEPFMVNIHKELQVLNHNMQMETIASAHTNTNTNTNTNFVNSKNQRKISENVEEPEDKEDTEDDHQNKHNNGVVRTVDAPAQPFNDMDKQELTYASSNSRANPALSLNKHDHNGHGHGHGHGHELYITPSELQLWFHNRFFVFEDTKTAFCVMEKNSCTMFKQIFKRIRGKRDYLSTDYSKIHYLPYRGLEDISFHSVDTLQHVLNDPDFYFATFVREPLERLLSGYMDKCVKKRGVNLCDYARWSPIFRLKFGDWKKAKKSRSYTPPFDIWAHGLFHCPCWPETDWHFAPQWNFCNLYQYAHKFDVFRFENRTHRRLWMERAGYWDKYGRQGWGHSNSNNRGDAAPLSESERGESLSIVDYGPKAHSSTNGERNSNKYIEAYAAVDADIFAQIIDAYRNDYIVFGMQMPQWMCHESIPMNNEVKRAIRTLPRTSRPPCTGDKYKWLWERE